MLSWPATLFVNNVIHSFACGWGVRKTMKNPLHSMLAILPSGKMLQFLLFALWVPTFWEKKKLFTITALTTGT